MSIEQAQGRKTNFTGRARNCNSGADLTEVSFLTLARSKARIKLSYFVLALLTNEC